MAALVTAVILSVLLGSVSSYDALASRLLEEGTRYIGCNQTITSGERVKLPRRIDCDFHIDVPKGKTLVLDLQHLRKKPIKCHKILVRNNENGDEQNLCKIFNGTSSSYTVMVKNNRQKLLLTVSYINNSFVCPGHVVMDHYEVPFSVSTSSDGLGHKCELMLSTVGILKLKVKNNGISSTESECSNTVKVSQGTHVQRMKIQSAEWCLSPSEEFEIPVLCGVSVVSISGPSVEIEAVFSAPTNQDRSEFPSYRCQ